VLVEMCHLAVYTHVQMTCQQGKSVEDCKQGSHAKIKLTQDLTQEWNWKDEIGYVENIQII